MAGLGAADAGEVVPVSDWEQRSIYDEPGVGGDPVHARMTDPVSSDLTVKSLGRDTGYQHRVWVAIYCLSGREELRHYDDGDSIAVIHDKPVTDDDVVDFLERDGTRHQRNVVARTRGLLRTAGWIERVDDVIGRTGRPTIAHIPTSEGVSAWRAPFRGQDQ